MLLATNTLTHASTLDNPRFYHDTNGPILRQVLNISFGWFKTLDSAQKEAYYSSIAIALEEAQPGEFARWYKNNASGMTRVVWLHSSSMGFCKRLHINVIAHSEEKNFQRTACFNDVDNRWRWYE